MRFAVYVLLFLTTSAFAADLTGLWYAPPPANQNSKRDLWLAIRVQGSAVTGEVESPTRNAPIVEGKLLGDGFSGIARSDWDGKLARRPIEGHLDGDMLRVSL